MTGRLYINHGRIARSMKIAVPYCDGQVFQHFGRAGCFKVYFAEGGKVVSSEVLDCGGLAGGSAMAELLHRSSVDVVICRGLGEGAMSHLVSFGIKVVSGASGEADAAVGDYLSGKLCESDAGVHACGCGH